MNIKCRLALYLSIRIRILKTECGTDKVDQRMAVIFRLYVRDNIRMMVSGTPGKVVVVMCVVVVCKFRIS